ncbi:cobaltochelatase subunit CobN [Rhodoferax sp.]|uniref:cobaltochelatase subunit CobN n=1 Tax=Rhodoferax sp. TaxID=50421 RepID=UPI002774D1C6|nr:cobaltochelatase subunit CobN [Rhodoferax sp.]
MARAIVNRVIYALLTALAALPLPALAQARPNPADKAVLFLSAAPVQPGKFERMKTIAAGEHVVIEARFVEQFTGQERASDFAGFELVVIDAPYGAALETAKARLASLLPHFSVPWIWMQSGAPQAKGLAPSVASTLHAYYSNGARANFAEFFCQINTQVRQQATRTCQAAQVFPDAAIYHPERPGQVFATLEHYLAWRAPSAQQSVVAVLFHQAQFGSGLTGTLDDTIAGIEAAGAFALPIYASAMGSGDIERLLVRHGKPVADVLINTQIMLNAEGRRAEFERLGIPVLQALNYRRGEQADWERDPVGLPTQDIPFYLAQPEYAGLTDPLVVAAARKADGDSVSIDYQLQSLVNKALHLAKLRRLPNADKRLAVFFWNYPPGEKNLGASYLNLPNSLVQTLGALQTAGYQTELPDADHLTTLLQRLLSPLYRDGQLQPLLRDGLAARLPMRRYRAWFDSLPAAVRDPVTARFGQPEQSSMALQQGGEWFFVIPRLQLGRTVILPQPPRGERLDDQEKALYHATAAPLNHFYLAAYLWAREGTAPETPAASRSQGDWPGAHALVHFGTHGSQEWTPGKERGLSLFDAPLLLLGDVPVVYPYIVDNIGEALQTKRRGRATVISHATPPFAPAGLHGEINQLHDLLHTWLNMSEGQVRNQTREDIVRLTLANKIERDMAWTLPPIRTDFTAFADALHIQLHELALANQPLGLSVFGQAAESDLRLFTVMQMLGKPLLAALAPDDPEEMIVGDYRTLKQTPVWKLLDQHVRQGLLFEGEPKLAALLAQARTHWQHLTQTQELANLLAALEGRYIPTSYGGDPIKNPDALPTGRNLYGFDPSRVPTRQAWAAGREATEKLIAQYREKHGAYPKKLAFSLWSVETMRHFGVLEAQAFAALGFKPKWDAGGRVIGIEAMPAAELKRPRVDVVLSATGLYRDHFPNVMRWLALAAQQAAAVSEPDNPVAAHSRELARSLVERGVEPLLARRMADTRIFSNASGRYGTGLDGATLASGTWGVGTDGKENRAAGEKKLADLYLARMQHAYGPDEKEWGSLPANAAQGVNLYAENLKGVQAALLSRSSNLYGMLTTDDPFQYLGGIALAVRSLGGASPELFISNLREPGSARMESAAGFLAKELRTRQFHPGWIEGMQKEGYSGALNMLDAVNNLWGWQAVAPEVVRKDQWDELRDVYINDKYRLGLNQWFERHHPHAQAQMIERMLEAARKDYWQADAASLKALAQRYQELAQRFDVKSDNRMFRAFAATLAPQAAPGFGLSPPSARQAAPTVPAVRAVPTPAVPPPPSTATPAPPPAPNPPAPPPTQMVRGQQLVKQARVAEASATDAKAGLGLVLMALGLGAWRRQRFYPASAS